MDRAVVKKVRLTAAEAKQLAKVAKRRKVSESEVIRDGLHREFNMDSRKKAIDQLIRWAEEEKEDWKKPDIDVKW